MLEKHNQLNKEALVRKFPESQGLSQGKRKLQCRCSTVNKLGLYKVPKSKTKVRVAAVPKGKLKNATNVPMSMRGSPELGNRKTVLGQQRRPNQNLDRRRRQFSNDVDVVDDWVLKPNNLSGPSRSLILIQYPGGFC